MYKIFLTLPMAKPCKKNIRENLKTIGYEF